MRQIGTNTLPTTLRCHTFHHLVVNAFIIMVTLYKSIRIFIFIIMIELFFPAFIFEVDCNHFFRVLWTPSSFDQYRHHYNCEVNGWMEVTLCAPKVASHCVLLNLSSTRSLFRYILWCILDTF